MWLLGIALAQQNPTFHYTAPDDPFATARDRTFATYDNGQVVYIASKDAGTYAKPGALTYVPIGAGKAVRIVQPSKGDTPPGEPTDQWYYVRTDEGQEGYVFGSKLTAARIEFDFDGDGVPEVATARFNERFQVELRILDGRRSSQIDLAVSQEPCTGWRGGQASMELVPTDPPFVRIDTQAHGCGRYQQTWLSYAPAKDRKRAELRLALQLQGNSDLPEPVRFQVKFTGAAATVQWSRTTIVDAEQQRQSVAQSVEEWKLEDGVFVPGG